MSHFTAAHPTFKLLRAIFFIALTLLEAAFAQAQTITTLQKAESATEADGVAQTYTITTQELDSLQPKLAERIARSLQYQYQLLEQPAFIVATSGTTTETIPNPNKWLQQHSITMKLSELFPKTTNFPELVLYAISLDGTSITFPEPVLPVLA